MPVVVPLLSIPRQTVPVIPGNINLTAPELTGDMIIQIGIISPQAAQTTLADIAAFIGTQSGSVIKIASFNVDPLISDYLCNPTSGPIVATLPILPFDGETVFLKDVAGTASPTNSIGLNGNGFLIDGQATQPNFIQVADGFGKVKFYLATGAWSVIG